MPADPARAISKGMGWSTSPRIVKLATIAALLVVTGSLVVATYDPASRRWPLGPVVSVGCGLIVAWLVLLVGNLVTHPVSQEITRAALDRRTYANGNSVHLIQAALLIAIGVMGVANLIAVLKFDGGWLAGTSCATFFAIAFYPAIRHRIERGRWPDS